MLEAGLPVPDQAFSSPHPAASAGALSQSNPCAPITPRRQSTRQTYIRDVMLRLATALPIGLTWAARLAVQLWRPPEVLCAPRPASTQDVQMRQAGCARNSDSLFCFFFQGAESAHGTGARAPLSRGDQRPGPSGVMVWGIRGWFAGEVGEASPSSRC